MPTFTKDGLERIARYATKVEAQAFADGFGEGAGHYGGDYSAAFVLPGDEEAMSEYVDDASKLRSVWDSLAKAGFTKESP